MGKRWMTVVETAVYVDRSRRCMSEREREEAVKTIAENPDCGDVLVGTGGVRKMRFAVQGRGKSGGVRIVYFFKNEGMPVFMLTVFAKNEKANLSQAERNELAKLVKILVATYGGKP
jgi:hypothetical protein